MWWQSFFDETYLELWAHLHPKAQCEDEAEQLISLLELSPGDAVLDAPCGYGRISIPLANRGLRVTGVDYSPQLLRHAAAREDSEQIAIPIRWIEEDLRTATLPIGQDAAINLFSSMGYGTEDDDLATLQTIHASLKPGGRLFIETMHRDAIVHSRALGTTTGIRGPSGITLRERNTFEPVRGIVESTWTWTSPTIAGSRKSTIRIYSVTELVALAERAGFTNIRCTAGLSGEPLGEHNLHERLGLIAVAGPTRAQQN
tara:strand:+ start:56979 stop:57752 length:774 start_codon:yes stop_codon:yes gene_type:complete